MVRNNPKPDTPLELTPHAHAALWEQAFGEPPPITASAGLMKAIIRDYAPDQQAAVADEILRNTHRERIRHVT